MDRTIIYRDANGHVTARRITILEEDGVRLRAFCHLRHDERTFYRDRIIRDDVRADEDLDALVAEHGRRTAPRAIEIALVGLSKREKTITEKVVRSLGGTSFSRFRPTLAAVVVGPTGERSRTAQDARAHRIPVLKPNELREFLEDGVIPASAVAPFAAEAHLVRRIFQGIQNWKESRARRAGGKAPLRPTAKTSPSPSEYLTGLVVDTSDSSMPVRDHDPDSDVQQRIADFIAADDAARRSTNLVLGGVLSAICLLASIVAETIWPAVGGLVVFIIVVLVNAPKQS